MSSESEEPLKRAGTRNPATEARILRDLLAWIDDPNLRLRAIATYRDNPIFNAKLYDFLESLAIITRGEDAIKEAYKAADAEAEAKIAEIKESESAAEAKATEEKDKKRASYIT